uniref:Sucrose transporter 4 n=1 Tax=Ginkgo biloba TaxID=3311 RepID=A0A3G4RXU7_GINBI|nr:sucrose transporter 4 [Ginkgo biloba]
MTFSAESHNLTVEGQTMVNEEKVQRKNSNKGRHRVPLRSLFRVASVACGVQFGWALQLSLLTPYVQELGIPHAWASLIWLCGPISGMLVQPLVGHMSDHCGSSWGRRRPFILMGSCLIVLAVLIIAYSSDLGFLLGDTSMSKPSAISIFVVGFWVLDLANNTLQGPCRALLADFTGKDHRRTRRANAFFSLFMAIGNILGFATGSYSNWYRILPFTRTTACDMNCANLKSAFLIGIMLLVCTTYLSMTAADEIPCPFSTVQREDTACSETPLLCQKPTSSQSSGLDGGRQLSRSQQDNEGGEDGSGAQTQTSIWELLSSFRGLSRPMWAILFVTALSWTAWFPFLLFDTDWMGREVYKGQPSAVLGRDALLYNEGVRMGSFGLLLNAVVLGSTSLIIEPLCRKWGPNIVWGVSNILLSLCFAAILAISLAAKHITFSDSGLPPVGIIVAALLVFATLGIPLAVTYSVPYALTSAFTQTISGGQGLSMGVLNLSIVIPQMIVSLGSGPWDQLFGGGNSPAFVVAAIAAFVSGMLTIVVLPKATAELPSSQIRS